MALDQLNQPSNEIDRLYLYSFGALRQKFSCYDFFNLFLQKILIEFFFYFFQFQVGSIDGYIDECFIMQIQENIFLSTTAHL